MTNSSFHKNLIYAAAFFISCCFVYSCENDPKAIRQLTDPVQMREEARDIESYLSQDGHVKAKLVAPLMYRVTTDTLYVEFPNTLHCDFYDDSTRIETWLDSKYGKYFESLNKVYLRDSVIVINVKGDTLKCPDLWWDQNTKLFYTDKLAYYLTKDKHITASQGMEATQDFSRVTFNKLLYSTVAVSVSGFPK
jgi:LPS export ABC transporter protein LptC